MPSILNATTTNGLVTSADNSGSLQLQTNNGTTAVTIDTSQNVGIGTTPFTNTLSKGLDLVNGAGAFGYSNGAYFTQNAYYDGAWKYKATAAASAIFMEAGVIKFNYATSGTAGASFSPVESMRITSGGDVLVNSTTAGLSGAGCQIIKYANGNYIDVGHTTGDTGSEGYIRFIRNGTTVGQVQSNGTTQVSYSTSSDYRLKENVAPMTGALAKVQQLKPVTYNWKSDGSSGQGFIAHELQAVVPDCVTGEKDAVELVDIKDEEGNVIGQEEKPVYQGVDTSFLVATLTAAIQELKAELNEVKAELDATKAEVQALKGVA